MTRGARGAHPRGVTSSVSASARASGSRGAPGSRSPRLDLARLYRDERRFLLGLVGQLGVPAQDREDCVHDVVVRLAQLAGRYDPARPLRPWLAAVARRVVWERGRARRELALDAALDAKAPSNPERELCIGRALGRLRGVSATLSPERRAVWLAHELGDLSAPELADALGVPLNTVYSRLRLARRDVCAALERAEVAASFEAQRRLRPGSARLAS